MDTSLETPSVERSLFDTLPDGETVEQYTLTAGTTETKIATYGGIVTSLRVPDRDGRQANVVLGFDTLDDYLGETYCQERPCFGALIGRYANRIAGGRFELDGQAHQLDTNEPPNHLHGGADGFDRRLWEAEPFADENGAGVTLSRTSPAGEGGYPGRLNVEVTYTLTAPGTLALDYRAETEAPTLVNLTHHPYFNLAGRTHGSVRDHRLQVEAGAFLPVDDTSIPTGERRAVDGTPFDLRAPMRLGPCLDTEAPQLAQVGDGFDHTFVLGDAPSDEPTLAARLWEPQSGRRLTVRTTEPGLQVYTGNSLDGALESPEGSPYEKYSGLALEAQHFPDSPNQPDFPSTVLRPGETYRSRTVYAFDVGDA